MLLEAPPLFETREEVQLLFPCRLEQGGKNLFVGSRALLTATSTISRIDLVSGLQIVGYVEGEAMINLRRRFRQENAWPAALAVVIVEIDENYTICYASPV